MGDMANFETERMELSVREIKDILNRKRAKINFLRELSSLLEKHSASLEISLEYVDWDHAEALLEFHLNSSEETYAYSNTLLNDGYRTLDSKKALEIAESIERRGKYNEV